MLLLCYYKLTGIHRYLQVPTKIKNQNQDLPWSVGIIWSRAAGAWPAGIFDQVSADHLHLWWALIRAADGRTFRALGKGDIQISPPNGDNKSTRITLKEVYYSPIMAFTLMSVSCVDHSGFSLYIKGGFCEIRTAASKIIGRIPQVRRLYRISNTRDSSSHRNHLTANIADKLISINELHRRMGHVNHEDLRWMVEKWMITGINLDMSSKAEFCETCIKAKAICKSFPKESKSEYDTYGDKVVSDVWGQAKVK